MSHGLSRDCQRESLHFYSIFAEINLIIMAMSSTVAQYCAFKACLKTFALISSSFLVPWVPEFFFSRAADGILRFDNRHQKLRKKNLCHPGYLSCIRRESAHNMLLALEAELSTPASIHFFSSPASFLLTWNLWFSDQSTSPHMSGLISSTLCVLQKGCLSWRNFLDIP